MALISAPAAYELASQPFDWPAVRQLVRCYKLPRKILHLITELNNEPLGKPADRGKPEESEPSGTWARQEGTWRLILSPARRNFVSSRARSVISHNRRPRRRSNRYNLGVDTQQQATLECASIWPTSSGLLELIAN